MVIFMRKIIIVLLAAVIGYGGIFLPGSSHCEQIAASEVEQMPPKLHAVAASLYDADSDTVIYGKNANDSMANASTTKILTCIVALENSNLTDMVTVSQEAASQPKVRLGLVAGNTYNMKDLMCGMMLESYNDCAYAIAEHVGGSVAEFCSMMNEKANEIGCYGTCFLTPNGLDAEDDISFHHTTANDLCRIMAYCAWESPEATEFLQITQTPEYTYPNYEGKEQVFTNHNRLLSETDYTISGKTGFTSKAGYCYVAAIEKDGRKMCLALLGCGWPNNKNYKWEDAKALVEYGCSAENTFAIAHNVVGTEKQENDNRKKNKRKDTKIQTVFLNYFTINIGFFY